MPGSDRSAKALLWMERLAWILIFGGGLAVSLGIFLLRGGPDGTLMGSLLLAKGGMAIGGGVLMIWLRSYWS
ncbi:hypothetical protein [Pelomonas sp. SE-A7]|uniref:hypothetical protein n=1 Tax=Pelomonas sp. SE-A7 TaxID=3054953 RepID=UPI00259D3043|nr:hypothetical protein [Pelomonas sp. SE-A7]MDM4766053.1 hypothetical protein [Pelomonas sp. SE-A7]